MAGRQVEVRCATFPEWNSDPYGRNANAYTTWATWGVGSYVVLSPIVCTALQVPTGAALLTLAHESVHMRGIHDERQAECDGLGLVPRLARWFGVTDAWGVTMLYRAARADNLTRPVAYRC